MLSPNAALLLALALLTGLSQFHRSALGVIAPELSADLALTPAMLGAANGMFFAALLVMQLPVGIALDRLGPRRLVAGLSVIAVLGIVLQSLATDGTALLFARALIGKYEGDVAEVQAPGGVREYEIIEIRYV